MLKKGQITFILLFGVIFLVTAGIFDRMQKFLDKGDFEKVEKLARKSLEKDTVNPGAKYYLSVLFFEPNYSIFNIDSSIAYIREAESDFKLASKEILNELAEANVDAGTLQSHHIEITDHAYSKALDSLRIEILEQFIQTYPESDKVSQALKKRDSIAFAHAKSQNTWQSYQEFYQTYPDADQVGNAKERYNELIYIDMTRDGSLESYMDFLNQFPQTPYRKEVEAIIFKKSNLDNSTRKYFGFIQKYPNSRYANRAGDILYHYLKYDQKQLTRLFSIHPRADSLKRLHSKQLEVILPVLKEEKLGFMTTSGSLQIDLRFSDVSKDYNCGNVQTDWLEVRDEMSKSLIVNRNGQTILKDASGADKISESVWLVEDQELLYHTSGFQVSELKVSDAQELENGWIAFQTDYLWGIVTLTGQVILSPEYTSIVSGGSFLILEQDGNYGVTNAEDLISSKLPPVIYDDYELIGDSLIQVFNQSEEALLDNHLDELVSMGNHEIYPKNGFIYTRDSLGYQFVWPPNAGTEKRYFKELNIDDGWLALKPDSEWIIRSNQLDSVFSCDSLISLSVDFVAGTNDEGLFIMWKNGNTEELLESQNLKIVASYDSELRFLDVYGDGEHRVFDQYGNLLFTEACDEISLLTDSLFRIKNNQKSGLINGKGQKVLDVEYDAVNMEDALIFTLKDGEIGTFDIQNNISIPASYESKIEKIASYYKVKSDGSFGLVDSLNQFVFDAEYEDILAWNDTSMWVNQNGYWRLQSIDMEVIMSEIRSVAPWFEYRGNMIYTFMSEDGMGLLSAEKGVLVEAKYNEIVNLGNDEQPVFFAEQVLKTADFYVVTYFDVQGNNIRSQAFRPDEYERIYCDQ